jgi:hypothetical protein
MPRSLALILLTVWGLIWSNPSVVAAPDGLKAGRQSEEAPRVLAWIGQLDVLRGLRAYVTADPENARTFARLYGQLPPAKQALDRRIRLNDRTKP